MSTNIRCYEETRDLEAIAAIDTKDHEEYWTHEEFKKQLSQKSVTCLVITIEDKIAGFMIYELFLHRFTILRIGVHPRFRHKKIGTQLVNSLIEKLTPEKRSLISAEVRESNLPVQLFLKSLGFHAIEVIREYYPDTGEDCFVFHLQIELVEEIEET